MNEMTRQRFLQTLEIVSKESKHLEYSKNQLFGNSFNRSWLDTLENEPDNAVILEAFVSRYGRLQDTIADKLLPRLLVLLAEKTGAQIDMLNRCETLGLIESTENWLAARQLRNKLVHEYIQDNEAFYQYLKQAQTYAEMMIKTYEHIKQFYEARQ